MCVCPSRGGEELWQALCSNTQYPSKSRRGQPFCRSWCNFLYSDRPMLSLSILNVWARAMYINSISRRRRRKRRRTGTRAGAFSHCVKCKHDTANTSSDTQCWKWGSSRCAENSGISLKAALWLPWKRCSGTFAFWAQSPRQLWERSRMGRLLGDKCRLTNWQNHVWVLMSDFCKPNFSL